MGGARESGQSERLLDNVFDGFLVQLLVLVVDGRVFELVLLRESISLRREKVLVLGSEFVEKSLARVFFVREIEVGNFVKGFLEFFLHCCFSFIYNY